MAGETAKCEAICLAVYPWSRTSHIVSWLTPAGPVKTVVKGAVRPKSAFLGQYDLNYTCQIVYYLQSRGSLHALRECVPVKLRTDLRGSFRALALAGYVRALTGELASGGFDAPGWFALADETLDLIERPPQGLSLLELMLRFDLRAMAAAGVRPDFSGYDRQAAWSAFSVASGSFEAEGSGRLMRVDREVAEWLNRPCSGGSRQILLDAARVIGVFYQFHLDCAVEARREVMKLILHNDNEKA
jgi:recombinational DNA repair protein (RecF pathway)